jgi:hypothetical protein
MTTEANFPPAAALSLSLLSMAAFHSIIYGRFWVITKDSRQPTAVDGLYFSIITFSTVGYGLLS